MSNVGDLDESATVRLPPLSWARWILALSWLKMATVIILVATARTGVGFYSTDMVDIAKEFPRPTPTYKGLSVLSPALASGLRVSTQAGWYVLHLALVAALFACIALAVRRRFNTVEAQRFVLVAILASGYSVIALGIVGHYDYWMLVAAVLLGLGRRWPTALLGGLSAGATNAEQALVAITALLLVMLSLKRTHVWRWAVALFGALGARAVVQFWYWANDVDVVTRGELFGERVTRGLEGFAKAWPLQLFTWYSAAWLVLLAAIFIQKRKPAALLLLIGGLIVLPGLATVMTLDGTRVFVATASPAYIWVVAATADDFVPKAPTSQLSNVSKMTLAVMCITPGLLTWVDGVVQNPWAHVFTRIGGLVGVR